MDPEILRELNESLRELNDTLKKQSSEFLDYSNSVAKNTQNVNSNTDAVNSTNKANNAATQSMTRYGQSSAAVDAENQRQNKLFGEALKSTGRSVIDFGKALTSADTSLQKYGASATNLGGQAFEIGKNFGLVGGAIGLVLAGLGLAANSILTLNQNIIDFRDGFTKQAGVLPVTTERLGQLASEAGFAYNRMPMLAKAVQNLGPSLTSLGGYAGEGAVRFMRIANVGEEQRRRFSRLGLQQEDLLEYQSYYIELQRASGNAAINRRKTDQQIQRESLEYAENLVLLSSLTGEKASTIQDREKQVTENIQEQARIAREDVRIQELQQMGTPEADEEIKKIEENREKRQRLMRATAAQLGVRTGEQMGTIMELGGYGRDMQSSVMTNQLAAVNLYERTGSTDEALREYGNTVLQNINRLGRAAEYDKQALEMFINTSDPEELNRLMRTRGLSKDQIRAEIERRTQPGNDPLAEAAASIQELEIVASQKFQAFLETIDPLRNGLEMFKDAAMIAAGVLGGGALIAGIAKVIGGRFGELGSQGNPMYAKIESGPGAPDAPGSTSKRKGIGARLKNIFRRSAAPAAAAAGVAPAAAAAGPLAGSATGASALSNAAGGPGGTKVGIFLTGLGTGLKALANPKVLAGSTILSVSIGLIGGAIAGATWMLGKTIPSLATGLKSFDEVDGDKLSKIGTGMAGMAAGLLAIGGSKITDAMGSLASWVSGDDSNPIENLQKELTTFQNIDVDPAKIEHNSKAFIAFNKMLAQATEINGTVAGALSRAFGSFFEVEIPLDKFKNFSDLEINPEQAEKNATAFKLFAQAMDSYKGVQSLDALGIIAHAMGGSVRAFYQALPSDDPVQRFKKFSETKIDGEQAKINASAFKDFANAMAEYKGGPGTVEALSQLVGAGITALFGVDGPIDAFKKFAQEDFGPNMERNTQALASYAASTSGAGVPAAPPAASTGADTPAPPAAAATGADTTAAPSAPAPPAAPPDAAASTAASTSRTTPPPVATPSGGNTSSTASSSNAPAIGDGGEAVLRHAQTLTPADRVTFFRSLASQGMQRAAAARSSGNSSQASLWERAANQYTLAAQLAEASAQTGASSSSSGGRLDIVSIGRDLQQRGLRVAEHPSFGGVSNVHRGRGHYEGRAIDINAIAGRDVDNPRAAATLDALETELQGKGLTVLWRTTGHYGHMHAEVPRARAAYGGIFSESVGGNSEAQKIGMLNPQSLISKLGKTALTATPEITSTSSTTEVETDLTPELLSMMENKLEKVLYALESNQDTHEKILKNSM